MVFWGVDYVIVPTKWIAIFSGVSVVSWLIFRLFAKIFQKIKTQRANVVAQKVNTPPGFARLTYRYIRDKHNGVCSLIRFED